MSGHQKTIDNADVSNYFDRCFEEGLFLKFEQDEFRRVKRLLDLFNIQTGYRVVEPGCGCGRLTKLLSEQVGTTGQIDACDVSSKMFNYCLSQHLPSQVRFHNKSVLDIEIAKGTIDCVVCFNVWPHFSPPGIFLNHFHKILKKNGALHIAHSRGRDYINSVHRNSSADTIRRHYLPPARELAEQLVKEGWKVLTWHDDADLYYIGAKNKMKKSDKSLFTLLQA
ncbi:MAG: class I SAM-dependent methyltransferase [Candidatus Sumerlaeota bacterium]|nr:class I SAM-dependent methyltransferase [Candidatus Sumerlaeota bacterium]